MEPARLFIIVCATIFIGIGIPAGLYFMLRRENRTGFIHIMQKSAGEIRQPFKKDQDIMDELARRVAELNKRAGEKSSSTDLETPDHQNRPQD